MLQPRNNTNIHFNISTFQLSRVIFMLHQEKNSYWSNVGERDEQWSFISAINIQVSCPSLAAKDLCLTYRSKEKLHMKKMLLYSN